MKVTLVPIPYLVQSILLYSREYAPITRPVSVELYGSYEITPALLIAPAYPDILFGTNI